MLMKTYIDIDGLEGMKLNFGTTVVEGKDKQGTEEEAAEAYDIAAMKFRGLNVVTNFDMSRYDVKAVLESNTLPIGPDAAKRHKEVQALESSRKRGQEIIALGSSFQYGNSSSNRVISKHSFSCTNKVALPIRQSAPNSQFYNSYFQNHHPALLQGMMNMGSSSSSVLLNDNNNNNVTGFTSNVNVVRSAEKTGLVKVDFDMSSRDYSGCTRICYPKAYHKLIIKCLIS
ncbi:unnamed protein product [Lupinus luteus]|uniref:AP2/ERF domain-containing protein n=1 Tax=Lupinus luteus TaxID=3873 RepID=A0AAV1W4S0_LUPLU